MSEKELFKKEKEQLRKWRSVFKYSLFLTFLVPIGLVIVLIVFNHQHLSFDLANLNNWRSVNDIFKFPFSCFSGGALISTLFGLRLRMLQTDLQLIKANYQIELATKKENATLYVEHKKDFQNTLDGIFREVGQMSIITNADIQLMKEKDFIYNYEILYYWLFPKNSFKTGVVTTEIDVGKSELLFYNLLVKSEEILDTIKQLNKDELKKTVLSGKNKICGDYLKLYNEISNTGMGLGILQNSSDEASYNRIEIIKFMPYMYSFALIYMGSIDLNSKEPPELSSMALKAILEIDKVLFSKEMQAAYKEKV